MQPESHGNAPRRSRKHHDDHDEKPHEMAHDESNWLVSYADMMTLLFGFFVLMYSFSKIDKDKFEVVSKDLAKYFGGKITDNPGAPEGTLKLSADVKANIETAFEQTSQYNMKMHGDTLILTLDSDVLFPPGSARPTEKAVEIVNRVYQSVKDKHVEQIEVEGHTDGDPISTVIFPSNWELSTARSASIIRIFENLKVPIQNLKVAGYANSHPLMPEKDDKGQPLPDAKSKNRRVVINLKIDPRTDLQSTLQQQGLKIAPPPVAGEQVADQPGANAGSGAINNLQSKYEDMNRKLAEASKKLAEAQAREKKVKELEALSKKTADMESKLQRIEKKTQETIQKTDQKLQEK